MFSYKLNKLDPYWLQIQSRYRKYRSVSTNPRSFSGRARRQRSSGPGAGTRFTIVWPREFSGATHDREKAIAATA